MASRGKNSAKATAMASKTCQKNHDSLYFTSKTPHFFKLLQRDDIQQWEMKIPAQFVRKYGSGISSPAYLKVPSGAMWRVELTKCNAEIWLQSGWREFVEHHSLELEDLLVFKYEGNCLFNVVIFDKGASEIEYPIVNSTQAENLSFNGQSQGPATEEEDNDDDTSVEILDEMPMASSKKRREKSPLPCTRPSRRMRVYSHTNRTEGNAKSYTLASRYLGTKDRNSRFKDPKRNGSSPLPTQQFSARGFIAAKKSNGEMNASEKYRHRRAQKAMVRGKEKSKALQRASSFKSQNPFFIKVIQPSAFTERNRTCISERFARENMMQKHAKVLCAVDGKTWSMEYNNATKGFKPRLCNGWKQFADDNKLDVGDVCVFELVKSTEIRFNVVVFPCEDSCQSLADENGSSGVKSEKSLVTNYNASKSKGAISSLHYKHAAQKSQPSQGNFKQVRHKTTAGSQDTQGASSLRTVPFFEASNNFGLKYPNFKIPMRSSYLLRGGLRLPVAFSRRYLMADTDTRMVRLQVAERSWPVKLKSYGSRYCFSGGWVLFARENSLRADDLCVFELISRSDAILRVSILKHEDES